MVERFLAKEEVASSKLVSRSISSILTSLVYYAPNRVPSLKTEPIDLPNGLSLCSLTLLTNERGSSEREIEMLYTLIAILVVLWILGLVAHIGGGLIHILLVVAAVVFLFNLLSGRRAAI